jgi:hypothetical protein
VPTPLWLAQERCCFILIDAYNSTERHDKLLVAQLKKLPACRTRSFSNEFVRYKLWALPGPHMNVTAEYSGVTRNESVLYSEVTVFLSPSGHRLSSFRFCEVCCLSFLANFEMVH